MKHHFICFFFLLKKHEAYILKIVKDSSGRAKLLNNITSRRWRIMYRLAFQRVDKPISHSRVFLINNQNGVTNLSFNNSFYLFLKQIQTCHFGFKTMSEVFGVFHKNYAISDGNANDRFFFH